jgi:hypothetical protein
MAINDPSALKWVELQKFPPLFRQPYNTCQRSLFLFRHRFDCFFILYQETLQLNKSH